MLISFYILTEANSQQSWLFACKLIEKFYAEQKNIYVHANTNADAEHLDTLLWTYKDTSFLPHKLYEKADLNPPPIQIGFQSELAPHKDLLINLSNALPTSYAQFNHVIEIVFSEPVVQQLARERFKQYRDQGCEI